MKFLCLVKTGWTPFTSKSVSIIFRIYKSFNTSKANLILSYSQPVVLAQNISKLNLYCFAVMEQVVVKLWRGVQMFTPSTASSWMNDEFRISLTCFCISKIFDIFSILGVLKLSDLQNFRNLPKRHSRPTHTYF